MEKEKKESVLLRERDKVNQAKSEQDMASAEYDVYMRKVREHETQMKEKEFSLEDYQKKLQGMYYRRLSLIRTRIRRNIGYKCMRMLRLIRILHNTNIFRRHQVFVLTKVYCIYYIG